MTKGYANKKCMDCKKLVRRTWERKGRICCYNCSRKYVKVIPTAPRHYISLEKALNRTYTIKAYRSGCCICSFPSVLAGYKIKIQLIEKEVKDGRDNN